MQSTFSASNRSSMEDRLEYLYINLVGQLVCVHTVDGAVTEGLFLSRTDEDAEVSGIILRHYRRCRSDCHGLDDGANLCLHDLLVPYDEIIYVDVANLRIRHETPGTGQVQGYRGGHFLEKLDWAGREELLEDSEPSGAWDQFAANEKLGVTSTYSEDKYTTSLNRADFTQDQLRNAEAVARQIDSSPATHGIAHKMERGIMEESMDEGTLYSDVARPGENVSVRGKKGAAGLGRGKGKGNNARGGGGGVDAAAAAAAAAASHNEPSPNDFNPAAKPFMPSRPLFEDFIKAIASAISEDPRCYECPEAWPGDDQVTNASTAPASLNIPDSNPYTFPPIQSGMGGLHNHPGNAPGFQGGPPSMMHAPHHAPPGAPFHPNHPHSQGNGGFNHMTPPPSNHMSGPPSHGMPMNSGVGQHNNQYNVRSGAGGHGGGGGYGNYGNMGGDPALLQGMPPAASGPPGGMAIPSGGRGSVGRPAKNVQPQQPVSVSSAQQGLAAPASTSAMTSPPPAAAAPAPVLANIDSGAAALPENNKQPPQAGNAHSNSSPAPRKMRRGGLFRDGDKKGGNKA